MLKEDASQNLYSLQSKLDRVQRELAVLYDVSNAMRTTLELNHILYIILTGVTAHTGLGFNRAVLFLVNTKERCLEPQMAIGPESGEHAQEIWEYISHSNQHLDDLIKEEKIARNTNESSLYKSIKHIKIPLSTTEGNLLANAYHQGNSVLISKEKINQYTHDPLLQIFKSNELVLMPLKAKDTVNGIIIADNPYTQKPITQDDLKIFTMLANQAGLAIENSRLYEMVMHKSHTDSGTGLWNHGFFQNQLLKEINHHQAHKQNLSLILMDIDNFKKLNDTYGHQNGDMVLKEISNILKEHSRELDYACRYGGEEFAIILPQTNKEQGVAIAERIRQKIEQKNFSEFLLAPLGPTPKITVSVGLATFPEDTQIKEELINLADKAMYTAKFGGKNQTCVAEKNEE